MPSGRTVFMLPEYARKQYPQLSIARMRMLAFGLFVSLAIAQIRSEVALGAEPIISEFMPDNERVLADEDGQFSDWIEVHNPGDTVINLAGYYLTDDPQQLTKWAFPSVTVSP